MLTMEQAYYIRYEYNNKGKSIRQISRETRHAFDTVKKYIAMEDFSPKPPVKRTRKGKTTKYRETVKTMSRRPVSKGILHIEFLLD